MGDLVLVANAVSVPGVPTASPGTFVFKTYRKSQCLFCI
jgi:hypothetical protein